MRFQGNGYYSTKGDEALTECQMFMFTNINQVKTGNAEQEFVFLVAEVHKRAADQTHAEVSIQLSDPQARDLMNYLASHLA